MTTLPASALTTTAKLRARLGCDADPDLLADMILLASEQIVSFIGRPLHYRTNIIDRLAGSGTPELVLTSRPIREVHSVDGVGVPAFTVESEDGILRAAHGSLWTWRPGLVGGSMREPIAGHDERGYVVDYDAGWKTPNQVAPSTVPTLPQQLQEACIAAATYSMANVGVNPAVVSESLMSYSVTYAGAAGIGVSGLPVAVELMLQSFKEWVQV